MSKSKSKSKNQSEPELTAVKSKKQKVVEESSDSSSDESDMPSKAAVEKAKKAMKNKQKPEVTGANAKKDKPAKETSDSSSDESAAPAKKPAAKVSPKKTPAKKADADSDSSSDENEAAAKNIDEKMDVDSDDEPKGTKRSAEEASTEVASEPQAKATKTEERFEVFVKGLAYYLDDEGLKQGFAECGEIVRANVLKGDDGRSRGSGFVEFTTEEAMKKAMEWDNQEAWGRTINVARSNPRPARTSSVGGKGKGGAGWSSGPTGEKPEGCQSVFVGNLPFTATDDDLWTMFQSCGNISRAMVAKDRETQKPRGFGYVDFDSSEAVDEAIKLAGQDFNGRSIRVDFGKGASGGFGGGKGKGKGGKGGKGKGKGKGGKGGDNGAKAKNTGTIQEFQGQAKTFADSDSD